jgi:hypothetical protein
MSVKANPLPFLGVWVGGDEQGAAVGEGKQRVRLPSVHLHIRARLKKQMSFTISQMHGEVLLSLYTYNVVGHCGTPQA